MSVESAEKLRMVLDYVPCERCLATPSAEQDLLCTICARIHRRVGVRVGVRTTVILERPALPEPAAAPVVIEPPAPVEAPPAPVASAPPALPVPPPIEARLHDPKRKKPWGETAAIEVILEPYDEPPAFAVAAPAAASAEPEEPEWDDVASFTPQDDVFEYARPERAPAPPEEPVAPAAREEFVFTPPPPREEPVEAPRESAEPEPVWIAQEDAIVEPLEETSPWAPPADPEPTTDFLAEEALAEQEIASEPSPWAPPEPEPYAAPEPAPEPVEEEILELSPVEEEIVEMEVVEEPAAPSPPPAAPETDLLRLRGLGTGDAAALRACGIDAIAHLAGHDPHELAGRSGIVADRLALWIQAADLVHEAGVPVDAASALVAAGVHGPRGLRDMEAETIADRVSAFGGASVSLRDIKRWKRRV